MEPANKPRKPRETTRNVTNAAALEITVQELRNAGRLADIDAARVQIAQHLAAMVDAYPDNPTLWREYRTAEKALREEAENYADPFDQLVRSLSAPVGNEKKPKTQNTRP